jgi:hypothetical protein
VMMRGGEVGWKSRERGLNIHVETNSNEQVEIGIASTVNE